MASKLKLVHLATFALILPIACLPAPLTAFERYNGVKKYDPCFSKYG